MRHGETILFDLINDLSYINILRDGHAHRHIFLKIMLNSLFRVWLIVWLIVHRLNHRIGRWENLQETPIFDGKNHGFL